MQQPVLPTVTTKHSICQSRLPTFEL